MVLYLFIQKYIFEALVASARLPVNATIVSSILARQFFLFPISSRQLVESLVIHHDLLFLASRTYQPRYRHSVPHCDTTVPYFPKHCWAAKLIASIVYQSNEIGNIKYFTDWESKPRPSRVLSHACATATASSTWHPIIIVKSASRCILHTSG